MPRVVATSYYHGSMEGTQTPFRAGEERDVPEATAAYLLATFPALFKAVEEVEPPKSVAPVVTVAPVEPPVNRKLPNPPRRR